MGIGSFLGPALSLGANFLLPGSGPVVGALTSGLLGKKNSKSAFNQLQATDNARYDKYLQAASPNTTDASGGTSKWTVDPATGARSQTMAFGPEEQKRRDMYNQAAGNRAQIGAGMDLSMFNQGPTFEKNERLKQSLMNAGGPRQPNAPMAPYQLTPKPVAPVAPVAAASAPTAPTSSTGLEGLTPEELQRLIQMLRSSGESTGGGNGNGGGGDGFSDGGGGPAGTW